MNSSGMWWLWPRNEDLSNMPFLALKWPFFQMFHFSLVFAHFISLSVTVSNRVFNFTSSYLYEETRSFDRLYASLFSHSKFSCFWVEVIVFFPLCIQLFLWSLIVSQIVSLYIWSFLFVEIIRFVAEFLPLSLKPQCWSYVLSILNHPIFFQCMFPLLILCRSLGCSLWLMHL